MSKQRPSRTILRLSLTVLTGLVATSLGACGNDDHPGTGGKDATTITFGISTKAPGGNMLQLGIAQVQGYFKSEGITVEPVFLGTGGKVVQALASDKVQIGMSTPDLVLQAADKGQDIKMFYNWTSANVTQVGVLPDSPIHSFADLKGKNVGVQDLSAGPAQLAKAAAANAGLNPDKDMKFIAVGTGAPALDALQRHRVDAMVTYDTLFSAMTTGTGQTLRLFQPDGVNDLFATSFITSSKWLKDHQDAAAGFGRAWAKASVYAEANPEAGVKMMFDTYPNSKVGANDDAATKAAIAQFDARQQSLYGGNVPKDRQWGSYPEPAVEHWITYAKDNGLIKTSLDPGTLYTNELVTKFNNFDSAQITKDAASGATP